MRLPALLAAAAAVAAAVLPAAPAPASQTVCRLTGDGYEMLRCEYRAVPPVSRLELSGAVAEVDVSCTVGGTRTEGMYAQAGYCYVLVSFTGRGTVEAGDYPV